MKTIFITGASSGLGRATAKLFAAKGWHVIATMRHPEKESELNRMDNISVLPLDISIAEQIKETCNTIISGYNVDVVFNNAATGMFGPFETATDEQLSKQIHTNLLGTMLVTREFIPYFRQRKQGLFLMTTSFSGLIGTPFSSILHATKWALQGWSESLWFELKQLNIGVKTILPGGMNTNFIPAMDRTAHPAYEKWMEQLLQIWEKQRVHWAEPEQVAETVYEAATDGKGQLRYFAGKDAEDLYSKYLELGDESFRKQVSELFFEPLKSY